MKKPVCEGCGEPLEKPRKNQRYHGERCRQVASRKRRETGTQGLSQLAPMIALAGGADMLSLKCRTMPTHKSIPALRSRLTT